MPEPTVPAPDAVQAQGAPEPCPPSTPHPPRRLPLALLALVATTACLLVPAWITRPPPPPASATAPTPPAARAPAASPDQTAAAPPAPALPADLLAATPPPDLPYQPPEAPRLTRAQIHALIDRFADEHLVERPLAHAIVHAESSYNPFAVSPVGAIGLMQVMPATASDYGVTDAATLFDPAVNLATGMRHLRRLLEKYDYNVGIAVMAYNAGEGAVDRSDTNLTYRETLAYSETVLRAYLGNGGTRPIEPTLVKLEQLRLIGNSGIVARVERKTLDRAVVTLEGLPELTLHNIDPRLRAARTSREATRVASAQP